MTEAKTEAAPVIKTLSLRQIKPYANNPRENHDAVLKVIESIRTYGYNQLIAVDRKHVIIAGHTRYLALRELGWKKAAVMVLDLDENKARAYRIIDNKTSEYAQWTDDLYKELRALDLATMQPYFEDDLTQLVAEAAGVGTKPLTSADVDQAQAELDSRFGHGLHETKEKEIACPHCGKTFFIAP
jgi:hypothetical protein